MQNHLKKIFEQKGVEDIRPTKQALEDVLQMSIKRFTQIWTNTNKSDMTITEKDNIENWLYNLFQEGIDILKEPSEPLIDKHQMLKG